MKIRLRQAIAMIALIAFVVTLLPLSALTEARTSFVRSQIDSRPAKPDSEYAEEIEIVPHKTEKPERSEIWDGSIATGFAGGSGTQEDPFLISNGSELAYLAQEVNDNDNSYSGVYFKLTNDIPLNDTSDWENWEDGVAPQNEWTAIGTASDPELGIDNGFYGYFDGDGYVVRGIYINAQEDKQGLFGYIGDESTIANLGVAESYICGLAVPIDGFWYPGGISSVVGYNNGTVTNCYNTGSVVGNYQVGGVVGYNNGTVTDCYNTGSVTGIEEYCGSIGGVVGCNATFNCGTTIANCYNAGIVNGYSSLGGVVGSGGCGTVTNCYNAGIVGGDFGVGGILGSDEGSNTIDCYNIGSVRGNSNVGGVLGRTNDYGATITNCYNTGGVSGDSVIGGIIGGNFGYSDVINCYNTGIISGDNHIGGVVGGNYASDVINCYNTGSVFGNESVGGVIGSNSSHDGYYDIIASCYNIGNISGSSDIAGVIGMQEDDYCHITNCYYSADCCESNNSIGTALTSEQLLLAESFEGFDFNSVWTMDGNPNYPYPELSENIHMDTVIVTPEPGDANGDGSITMADAAIIARMVLNLIGSVPAADFNGDGSINMADATLTARKALNLI